MEKDEKNKKGLSEYWMYFLFEEFSKETDRAAIILATALIENALTILLKNYLVLTTSREDDLFDGPTAPLSDFSSKIQFAYRLGLISQKLTHDLNIIRKIRNEFAHNVYGSNLESGIIKDQLTTLIFSSNIIKNYKEAKTFHPKGARGDFLMIANIILFHLNQEVEQISKRQAQSLPQEWIYSWVYKSSTPESEKPPTQLSSKTDTTEPTP